MSVSTEAIIADLQGAGLLVERRGTMPATIATITDDSRTVRPGDLFVAIRGSARDGHDFLDAAAEAGAVAAVVEDPARSPLPALVVRDGRRAAAMAAAAAYGWPARELRLVGVTGTSGKTTTVGMIRHLLDHAPGRSASIGTLGVLLGSEGAEVPGGGGLTTPAPIELQRIFRQLVDAGVGAVAMEVSSHSLDQHRIEGVDFDVAVFTNISRDHLDYHKTMEAYVSAKMRLLDHLRPHGTTIVNADEKSWTALPGGRRRVSFSQRLMSTEVHAENVRYEAHGTDWVLALGDERFPVRLPLIGEFNVSNALAAAAAAWAIGVPGKLIAHRLSSVPQVPGRLEVLHERPTVLRDYSHKPDALDRALDAVRPFVRGRLILVFGCGGDRDKGKRPEMGAIAEKKADVVILTSDNPRTEDPERILDDIERGMSAARMEGQDARPGRHHRVAPHERIEDRRHAIERALDLAAPQDLVMLAGKGHETYQIRGTTKYPFDEKTIVDELYAKRS